MNNINESEFWNLVAEQEIIRTHVKRAERAIKKEKIADLVSQGVDKEMAKIMVESGIC